MPRSHRNSESILVIGLGRFGGTLALELERLGNEVLGVDADARPVQLYSTRLTKTLQSDTTDAEALRQLGVVDFDHVVVGIGDVEASILTTTELIELGVTDIWAKAVTEAHARILTSVGASHVVRPEHDMGQRVAHRVTGKMIDFIELDTSFALVETVAPASLCGVPLAQANIRQQHDVTVVCIKPVGGSFTYATPDTVIKADDILLVAGQTTSVERFSLLE